jgi:hypothetical protein
VRASAVGCARLAKLGAYAGRALERAIREPDGWSRIALPIETIDHAALALLGVGPEVEIVEPAELRARVRELAEEVVGLSSRSISSRSISSRSISSRSISSRSEAPP